MMKKYDNSKLVEKLKKGRGILLDVREEKELRTSGIIKGAFWVPKSGIVSCSSQWQNFLTEQKGKLICVYCAAGGRSEKIVELLIEKGFSAENVGGFKDLTAYFETKDF